MDYYATGNLKHNGKTYARGEQVEFAAGDTDAIEALLAAKAIQTEPVEGAAPSAGDMMTPEAAREPQEGMKALSPDVRADAPNAPQTGSETPVEPTEAMRRADLEQMAITNGVAEADAKAAPNKGALVTLINEARTPKGEQPAQTTEGEPAAPAQPENDPSAGL